jgi:general stress protein CsbA
VFKKRFSKYYFALSQGAFTWIATLACLLSSLWLLVHGQFNLLAFLFALVILLTVTTINKPLSICLTIAYLFLLGDIRRVVNMFAGFPKLDPLLLVGPVVSLLLALPLLLRLRLKDSLSKATLSLMVVMLLEIFNPRQGSVAVGFAGAMFYVVPLLWFWIGREYGTNLLLADVIYKVLIPLAVLAAALGAWQTYVGFLPWESAWITQLGSSFHALNLGGGFIRAFGFSVNSVEYSNLLLVASVCVLAAFFAGRRRYGLLFPGLVVVLFLASSRSSMVKLLFAVAAAWALSSKRGKGWAIRLPFALAVGIGLAAFLLSQISLDNSGKGKSAASFSTEHQVQGLEHPFDSKHSTADVHATMFLGGFRTGFSYPIGYGLGAVTLGSGRLGGDATAAGSSEVDISDSFISMGIIGGLLYLYTIFLVIRRAIAFGRIAPKYVGLPALAILAAMGGGWIALGQYGIGPLVWFVIGVLSRHAPRNASLPQRTEAISSIEGRSLGARPAAALASESC